MTYGEQYYVSLHWYIKNDTEIKAWQKRWQEAIGYSYADNALWRAVRHLKQLNMVLLEDYLQCELLLEDWEKNNFNFLNVEGDGIDNINKFLKILDDLASMDIETLRELVDETYFNCEYNYHVLVKLIEKEKINTIKLFSVE